MVVVQSFTTVLLKTHWGISCGEVYTTFGRFAPKPTVILSYHFHDFSKRRVSFVGYCPIKDGKENFIIVEHIQKDHSWTREFTQSKHDKHCHSTVTFLWKKNHVFANLKYFTTRVPPYRKQYINLLSDQWTSFYLIGTSVMKKLSTVFRLSS